MAKKWLFLIFIPCLIYAEQTKTIYNPFTGKFDFITKVDSTTLPSGSTNYIQNTFTPSTTTQVFSVQSGSFSVAGIGMVDSAGCKWTTTIATTGALVTTLVSCPAALTGQCIGILCGVTYN